MQLRQSWRWWKVRKRQDQMFQQNQPQRFLECNRNWANNDDLKVVLQLLCVLWVHLARGGMRKCSQKNVTQLIQRKQASSEMWFSFNIQRGVCITRKQQLRLLLIHVTSFSCDILEMSLQPDSKNQVVSYTPFAVSASSVSNHFQTTRYTHIHADGQSRC